MAKSAFVSITAVNGKVTAFEGNIQGKRSLLQELNDAPFMPIGRSVNDVMNMCANAGYEHFATETIGNKVVHRFKLVSK